MKMNSAKRRLLAKEFPFLGNPGKWRCPKCSKTFETWQGDSQSDSAWCPRCRTYVHDQFEIMASRSVYTFLSADEINVRKADTDMFNLVPWVRSYSWSGGGYSHHELAYAISEGEVIPLSYSIDDSYGNGSSYTSEAESVGCQLLDRKIYPEFIVIDRFRDHDANGNGQTEREVTIYKNNEKHLQYESMIKVLKDAYNEVYYELSNGESILPLLVHYQDTFIKCDRDDAVGIVKDGGLLCFCLEDGTICRVHYDGTKFIFSAADFV